MKTLVFSPAAQSDIAGIYNYSLRNWGVDQAETYIRALRDTCRALAAGTKRGLDAGHVRPGYFKQSAGSHLIFFKPSDTEITVIRILHQNMDFERHL